MTGDSSEGPSPHDEWSVAQTTLQMYDNRIADLRKYGLTFLAGLLTAQGLTLTDASSSSFIVPPVKMAIILSTILLVCTIFLLERIYRELESAAGIRARILEKSIGYELTEDINAVYSQMLVRRVVDLVYTLFIGVAVLLGWFVLTPSVWSPSIYSWVVLGAGVGAGITLWLLLDRSDTYLLDWDSDNYEPRSGGSITLTLSNYSPLCVGSDPGVELGYLVDPDGTKVCPLTWPKGQRPIEPGTSRSWPVSLTQLSPGSYTLMVRRKGWKFFRHTEASKPLRGRNFTVRRVPVFRAIPRTVSVSPS